MPGNQLSCCTLQEALRVGHLPRLRRAARGVSPPFVDFLVGKSRFLTRALREFGMTSFGMTSVDACGGREFGMTSVDVPDAEGSILLAAAERALYLFGGRMRPRLHCVCGGRFLRLCPVSALSRADAMGKQLLGERMLAWEIWPGGLGISLPSAPYLGARNVSNGMRAFPGWPGQASSPGMRCGMRR